MAKKANANPAPVALPKVIVAATDFSHGGENAVLHAWSLARRFKARLVLVHVFDGRAYAEVLEPSQRAAEAMIAECLRDAEERLAGQSTRLRKGKLDVRFHVVEGSPADKQILAMARRHAADLIVVGTHGRRGLPRAFLGSIAENVLRGARVPVLVVR